MAAIVNTSLAGHTITYNGVQFGGSDADYQSFPPQYNLSGEFLYDDTRRAVIGVRYRLTVATIFYAANEIDMAESMAAIRLKLSQPAKQLKIEGLGLGFDAVTGDIDNGPRPIGLPTLNPIGNLSWETVWTVEFTVSECAAASVNPLAWLAFNFGTTWQNDFEGMTQRTIAGSVQIALRRAASNSKNVAHVAEEVRGNLLVVCPPGFRRTSNVWRESEDKGRIDFVVVDEQLPGESLPAGITMAEGSTGVNFGNQRGNAFAEATVTMNATYKVAPDKPRNLAGIVFLTAAVSKTAAMNAALAADKGIATPMGLSLINRKYDQCRITECSMSWVVTKCFNAIMAAADIWAPITPNDYTAWRTSVDALWGNRGTSLLRSLPTEAVIIDLCDNATQGVIGNVPAEFIAVTGASPPTLTCPEVPEDGGWIKHELKISIYREDRQSWHKLAKSYLPQAGSVGQVLDTLGEKIGLGGPNYTQSESEKDIPEHHGYPDVLIGVQFKGLRVKRKPPFPELKTVAGIPARLWKQNVPAPTVAFELITCPVWFINGWRIYRLSGNVASVKAAPNKVYCTSPADTQDY